MKRAVSDAKFIAGNKLREKIMNRVKGGVTRKKEIDAVLKKEHDDGDDEQRQRTTRVSTRLEREVPPPTQIEKNTKRWRVFDVQKGFGSVV